MMTVHVVSMTVPFPAGPQEAATAQFTIPIHELGRWAGSSLGSYEFLPKLNGMGCVDEVTEVLEKEPKKPKEV